ncbi:hypothetical protein [Sporosarcina ureae]|uniref:hypothetical protein n=1 Tax=Sporosarcina ureae TaxID=1571 RepID=UPI0026F192C3|nr:hypothetical protein [Sporosarcina ureae]
MISIFKLRKRLIKSLTIGSPIIAIGLVYFFGFEPLNLFKDLFNEKFFNSISKDATAFIINQAIIIFIINLAIELYRHFGNFAISVKNKDRKDTTYLALGQLQQRKKVDIDVKMDYRNLLIKRIFNSLGGLNLYIHIPHWVTFEIRNKSNFHEDTFDLTNIDFISISLDKGTQARSTSSCLYISAEMWSNATSFVEGDLISEIKPASTRWYCRLAAYILIFLLFEIEESHHNIISTRS